MKTIRAKQAKAHFAYFVQRDHHGKISVVASFLNSPTWLFHVGVLRMTARNYSIVRAASAARLFLAPFSL